LARGSELCLCLYCCFFEGRRIKVVKTTIMLNSNSTGCPYGYNPYFDNKTNALTPCFISLTSISIACFFAFIGLIQIILLLRETRIPPNFKYISKWSSMSLAHYIHISTVIFQSLIWLGLLFLWNRSMENTSKIIGYSYLINFLFTVLISVPTQFLEFFRSTASIGGQIFYSMFLFFNLSTQIIQRLFHPDNNKVVLIDNDYAHFLEWVLLFNTALIFTYDISFYNPSAELIQYYKENQIYIRSNVLADISFTWMNKLITETYRNKKVKDPHNLPLPPIDLNIREVSSRLNANWETQRWNGKNSLLMALLKTFGSSMFIAIVFETTKDLLAVIEPQFLRLFIDSFNIDGEQKYPLLNSFFIVICLFLTNFLSTFLNNQFYIKIFEVGLGIRGSVAALIYQKSLRLSLASRESYSTGDIINFVSVDVLRLQRFFENSQVIIGAPIQIVIVLTSLYWLLGEAVIGGIVTMAIMIPINAYLSKKVKSLNKEQMKYKDIRIRTLTEILNSIKSIKLYSWEKPMLKRLDHVRNDLELESFKKIGIVSNCIFFAWNCVPIMVTCSSFIIFALTSGMALTPDIVFPALALFNILNDAIYSVPSTITNIIEVSVSLGRLKNFLATEELDRSFIEQSDPKNDGHSCAVEIDNATFLWKGKKNLVSSENGDEESTIDNTQVAFKNVNHFEVKEGSLTCIVGRVGSGKTTLLRAVLGQLPCISGAQESIPPKLIIRGNSIAYCPQQAWIMNSSVKENILFGHKYDEHYYNLTIEACQLTEDLKMLPDGDETIVGEKGISLSGGQKARLSLARAVYSRSDIYLLDDILSAVDAEVSKNIIEKVLDEQTGLLKSKTIILTTNAISVLKHSQKIYALENCEIIEEGAYDDVMNSSEDSKLKALINEFDNDRDNNSKEEVSEERKTSEETSDVVPIDDNLIENDDDNLAESTVAYTGKEQRKALEISSRKASMATLKPRPIFDINKSDNKTAQKEETTAEGRVKTAVYIAYIKACGVSGVALFFIFMLLSRIFDLAENFWLKHWSESNQKSGSNENLWMFVGVYALIGIISAAFNNLRSIVMLIFCSIRGSKKLHDNMALSVVYSPMSFFETTPIGRIINRFSGDLDSVDSGLQFIFSHFFRSLLGYIVTVILVGYNMPWFFVFNIFLIVIYFYYQAYYIVTSRELKRLTSITYSPIMSLISETLAGYLVINAYNHAKRFSYFNFESVQFNIDCLFNFRSTNRWLSVRLQAIGALIVLATGLLSLSTIGTSKQLTAGMVGLLMSYSLQVTNSLMWIVRMSVQIETNIVSVERILEYCELPPEPPHEIEETKPEKSWPAHGSIKFIDYSTKYRKNLDPVLNKINLEIEPREKIGIVGRTGAGKSTLTLALFRILEATDGKIVIDGVDISTLGLSDLRSNLAIIPQDAQAFEGTIRTNLDPFDQHSDEELWKAIEASHLKPHLERIISNRDDNSESEETNVSAKDNNLLEIKINENGSNLSVGQRQLLCLSRALLNHSKILVLDEATASVDMETDKIIQETIRNEFSDRTILTIAHRIDTVLGYDKILVLDKGEVREFDSPDTLLENKNSIFYNLCEKGGYLNKALPTNNTKND
ncbi:hypothetical protein Kpol_1041p45, partial [Vanderwaltozyma polyspora DSM 70294]